MKRCAPNKMQIDGRLDGWMVDAGFHNLELEQLKRMHVLQVAYVI